MVNATVRMPDSSICGSGASIAFAVLALQACSSYSPAELANPTQIHQATVVAGRTPTDLESKASEAASLVPLRYYKAMDIAKEGLPKQADLDVYVREGIAVVELYCLRWFSKLEDAQRSFQVTDTNRNVITQLGTTVIGLAKLNSGVTAGYGALNSAIGGFNANFTSAFLAAPNAENVKRLTLDALQSRAALLKDSGSALYPKTFSEAFVQLEKLAGQCTYSEVKRLTTKSVDQSNVSADPATGEAIVFSTATRAQATGLKSRVETILGKIDALKPADAIAFTRVMPFRTNTDVDALVKATDPASQRFTDDKVARAILKRVFILTSKSDSAVAEWETRLGMLSE